MQTEQSTTRWAVIRVIGNAREMVETWSKRGDAQADAMHLMSMRPRKATYYYVVERVDAD